MHKTKTAPIECPRCGALYTALLGERAPDWPLVCVECDAPLPSKASGRLVYELTARYN